MDRQKFSFCKIKFHFAKSLRQFCKMWIRDAFVFVGSLARNIYPTPYLSLWPHSRENHSNTHNKLLRADSGLILAQNDHGGSMESRQSAARAPKPARRAGDRRSPARRAGLGLNAAPPQKPIGPPQPYAHLRAKVQYGKFTGTLMDQPTVPSWRQL